ncbi:SpoIIE family protein phosphatase, partial [Gracilinema caldarium]|uniref:SpoIIE family protein phosphatase n=1 Tax=Gracilinema caldarium TaxID=215591 RepID=UPI0026EB1ED1
SHFWKEDLFGQIEIGGINVPIPNEELSGDCWTIEPLGNRYRVFLADGLGHGKAASDAAITAVTLFRKNKTMRLEDLVYLIHQGLMSTRGVVLSILEIDQDRGKLLHIGVGNISTRIINSETQKTLLSSNGTVGVNIYKTYINEIDINKESIIIIHSDGINEHWNQKEIFRLWNHHPAVISGWLYHQYGRPRDDASCVVIKIHDRG